MSAQTIRRGLIAAAAAAFAAAPAMSQMFGPEVPRYVDANASTGGNGQSWSTAYKYLQDALYDASNNSSITQIRVAGGTYYPDEDEGSHVAGDRTDFFSPPNGIKLEGGYRGQSGLPNNADVRDETSTLSGDVDGDGTWNNGNSYQVVRTDNVSSYTLDGFTIKWGYADHSTVGDKNDGGAIYLEDFSTVTIKNCILLENFGVNVGGAIGVVQTSNAPTSSTLTIQNCDFDYNEVRDTGGGLSYLNGKSATGHNLTIEGTDFTGNNAWSPLDDNAAETGGALAVRGADVLTVDDCRFIENWAMDYAGAVYMEPHSATIKMRQADFTGCLFEGNYAQGFNGGAVYLANSGDGANDKAITFDGCDFIDNESNGGGGAIWVLTEKRIADWDTILDLTDCKFIGNIMDDTTSSTDGGGAVFLSGHGNPHLGNYAGIVRGTWTNCDFIGNLAVRGDGAYIHDTRQIDIIGCRFVANGDEECKAGGGIGIGDPKGFVTTDVRICKSMFVSNFGWKGGAVHNHEGATTYMVNCRITGNNSTQEGGGVFNSRHTGEDGAAKMFMHNCIIAGNIAENGVDNSDQGGGVFNGLGGDLAETQMVHCTVLGNYAGYKYGGVVSSADDLYFYNSITRDNDSASEADTFKNQLFHVAGYSANDAENFLAQGSLPSPYTTDPNGVIWSSADPVFLDDGSGSISWTVASYDPDTGLTTFTTSNTSGAAVNELFKPSTSNVRMLVIESVVANTSVTCWGYWPDGTGTAKLYDLHIDSSGVADEFGDTNWVPDDFCDIDGLNGTSEPLPWDLGEDTREVNDPDCGVYEIQS